MIIDCCSPSPAFRTSSVRNTRSKPLRQDVHFPEVKLPSFPHPKYLPHSIPLYTQSTSQTTTKSLTWFNYRPLDVLNASTLNFLNVFHGILHYIRFHSNGQYNIAEIFLEYSSIAANSDPINILNPINDTCFNSGWTGHDCLVFTFQRIAILPTAFVISCGPWVKRSSPYWSFVFQGWNDRRHTWITLEERNHELRPYGRWKGFMIDIDRTFRKFRFLYTGTVMTGIPSFSISAFEIHGTVFPDDKEVVLETVEEFSDGVEFSPWAIQDTS
jgi:hypothetical protein